MRSRILILLILSMLMVGCKANSKTNIIPQNYTSEIVLKLYNKEGENSYKIDFLCRENNYSIKATTPFQSWNTSYLSDSRFIINNDKFPESSSIIENFKLSKQLIYDFDLEKFKTTSQVVSDQLIYCDGTYKHLLNFSKENFLPESILIYKNDKLVKTIQYEKIKVEK